MRARLYTLPLSHPGHAARLMLERKGIEHDIVNLPSGLHPLFVRALRFPGATVPALAIDGRRIVGSRPIARVLDELVPSPPLFPADPDRRRAVEEAERWGDLALQGLPRRIMRWSAVRDPGVRRFIAEGDGLPGAGLAARVSGPVASVMAGRSHADEDGVRDHLAHLPELLDHVDALIADGVIGDPAEPNAADFQIACTLRSLMSFEDLRPLIEPRPAGELGLRLGPDSPRPPVRLPREWLPAAAPADAVRG